MGRYWALMGDYNGESQNYEALAGAFQTSPFTPLKDGRLKGIRVVMSAEAATSLTEAVEYRLTCTEWTPNVITIIAAGNGIDTALTPRGGVFDYEIDQPIKSSVQIAIEGKHAVATAVTHRSFVLGLFEAS